MKQTLAPMFGRFVSFFFLALAIHLAGLQSELSAQEDRTSAASFFPGSVAIYAEISQPASAIDRVMNHPFMASVQSLDAFKEFLASPEVAPGLVGLKMFETQTGEPVLQTMKTHFGRGLAFGFDTKTEAPLLAFRTTDEATLKQLAGKVLAFAKNSNAKIERKTYRGAKVAQVEQIVIARFKDWFLVSTQADLLKSTLDRLNGDSKPTLSQQDWFNEARAKRESKSDVWATIDLKTFRSTGIAKELFAGRTDNAFAELMLGGLFDTLKNANFAGANLTFDPQVTMQLVAPHRSDWTLEARKFFFGNAPRTLPAENLIAAFSVYRDLGQWWLAKEELFDESVVAQLAQVDSQFSTIFSGLDFGEEVLSNIKPEMQIVVAQNRYSDVDPDIKLPAFAMVSELKEGNKLKQRFKIAFQSAVGFANINLGMTGQPQLLMNSESIDKTQVSSASYMVSEESDKQNFLMNFGPTIAFNDSHFVLSTNREFAIELAGLAQKASDLPMNERTLNEKNTSLVIKGSELRKILELNKESLIANNMLENGNSRDQAKSETTVLLNIVTLIEELSADFETGQDAMKLTLRLTPGE